MKVSKKFNRLEQITCVLNEQEIEQACLAYARGIGGVPEKAPFDTALYGWGDEEDEPSIEIIWRFEKPDSD